MFSNKIFSVYIRPLNSLYATIITAERHHNHGSLRYFTFDRKTKAKIAASQSFTSLLFSIINTSLNHFQNWVTLQSFFFTVDQPRDRPLVYTAPLATLPRLNRPPLC